MISQHQLPLVSVRVLTYNSAQYIVETLNSVFQQTYNNIELIISDDCSQDETVSVVEKWIKSHKDRFVNVVFLTSSINIGVCANSKRSLNATTGDWIKGLGGDDLLTPNAITEFVSFVQSEKCDICASKMSYINDEGEDIVIKHGLTHVNYLSYLKQPYEKQYSLIKQKIIVPGPVLFYSRKVFTATEGPDERYGAADEWSFLYKVLKLGFRIHPLESVLIKYRVRGGSLTHVVHQAKTPYYRECNCRFIKEVIMPDLWHNGEVILYWHNYIQCLVMENKKRKILNLFDPMWYMNDATYSVKARLGIL